MGGRAGKVNIMKKKTILILLGLIILYASYNAFAEEAKLSCYKIEPGRIILYSGDSVKVVPVDGTVEQSCLGEDGLYYIKSKEEHGTRSAFLSCIDRNALEIRYDNKLPLAMNDLAVKKLIVYGEYAHILTRPVNQAGGDAAVHRITLATMEPLQIPDAIDFFNAGGDLLFLKKVVSGLVVLLNGQSVPLAIKGDVRIQGFVDGRLVFATNGDETEVIDIRTVKSLYQYSSKFEYLQPEDYNLSIQTTDDEGAEPVSNEMLFFKVFVNGAESGRTTTAPARVQKEFKILLEPNKEYIIQLERWALNSAKGRYERANNIFQPKTYQLFMPQNRVMKLTVKYTGKEYLYDLSPLIR